MKKVKKELEHLVNEFISSELYITELTEIVKKKLKKEELSFDEARDKVLVAIKEEIGFVDDAIFDLFTKWQIYKNLKSRQAKLPDNIKKLLDDIYAAVK